MGKFSRYEYKIMWYNYKIKSYICLTYIKIKYNNTYICPVMPHCSEEDFTTLFKNYHNLDDNEKKIL